MTMAGKLRFTLLAGAIGCAPLHANALGTTVVDFAYDVTVRGKSGDGREWVAKPDELVTSTRDPAAKTPFPVLEYRGSIFTWQFAMGARAFGGRIQSLGSGPVCFRFDQATLKSDSSDTEAAMQVSSVVHRPAKGSGIRNLPRPNEVRKFTAPKMCFSNLRPEHFDLTPDLTQLFPNNRLFNVRLDDVSGNLLESGEGHWVEVGVPIEYDGTRETLTVRFTATASKTRTSFH